MARPRIIRSKEEAAAVPLDLPVQVELLPPDPEVACFKAQLEQMRKWRDALDDVIASMERPGGTARITLTAAQRVAARDAGVDEVTFARNFLRILQAKSGKVQVLTRESRKGPRPCYYK
jgi:hypothetical protein